MDILEGGRSPDSKASHVTLNDELITTQSHILRDYLNDFILIVLHYGCLT
jgi:hypothetical protein